MKIANIISYGGSSLITSIGTTLLLTFAKHENKVNGKACNLLKELQHERNGHFVPMVCNDYAEEKGRETEIGIPIACLHY